MKLRLPATSARWLAFAHLSSFFAWLLTTAWTSLYMSYLLLKGLHINFNVSISLAMPRKTYGDLQASVGGLYKLRVLAASAPRGLPAARFVRWEAADIQSPFASPFVILPPQIFPTAFTTATSALLALLLGLALTARRGQPSFSLTIAFASTVLNQLVLEPLSNRVLTARRALEAESATLEEGERRRRANGLRFRFGFLNAFSTLVNFSAVAAGALHVRQLIMR